jgi:ABC-type siderophore export system fused ATPase/permease subunit
LSAIPEGFSYLHPDNDTSKPLIKNQWVALAVGVVVSLVALRYVVLPCIGQLADVLGQLFWVLVLWVLVALYFVALSAFFLVAKPYKRGMTKAEILFTVFWPVGLALALRNGLAGARQQLFNASTPEAEAARKPIISENVAKWVGYGVVALSGLGLLGAIGSVFSVAWTLFWLIPPLFITGMLFQFWISQAWKDGFTQNEGWRMLLWFKAMPAIIKVGLAKFSN